MKQTIKSIKKKAWKEFSLYIRERDCIKTTGSLESGVCVTCGKIYAFKKLQAGHVIDGRGGNILFEEKICFIQCMPCNVLNHGMKDVYIPWFIDTYGRKLYDEFERKKKIPKKWTIPELEAQIERIKKLREKLKEDYERGNY